MRLREGWKSIANSLRKIIFFAGNFIASAVPDSFYRAADSLRFSFLTASQKAEAARRAAHYCCLPPSAAVDGEGSTAVRDFIPSKRRGKTAIFFDMYPAIRCVNASCRFFTHMGDIRTEPARPTFVKTRPITGKESNSVILRLNSLRHFHFTRDKKPWHCKQDRMVFRNVVRQQPWRSALLQRWASSPLCDLGAINADTDCPEMLRPFMQRSALLDYKFIACIEGNDVASNLKWVMASNSIAVMPRPTVESWFMEGELLGGVHYIEVRPDYEDLEEKLRYYLAHPDESERIIRNAHAYVRRFRNRRLERYTRRLTVERYFRLTDQYDTAD